MKDVCEFFIESNKPKSFGDNNEIVKFEKSLESMKASLEESGVKTDNLTVYEFYTRIEHFEKKYSKLKQNGSNKQA